MLALALLSGCDQALPDDADARVRHGQVLMTRYQLSLIHI